MSDYFVEGGDVLKNKLNISNPGELRRAEEDCFSDAATTIINDDDIPDKLDFTYLKELHGKLFGKIYDFAGKIRTVNITKIDSSIPFCYADFIESEAERIFSELEKEKYLRGRSKADFVDGICWLLTELNALHPFREGNGRTIRFYLQMLGMKAGYIIKYKDVSHEEIIEADKLAFLGKTKNVRELYNKIVEKI
jgi:cell filamentation protein